MLFSHGGIIIMIIICGGPSLENQGQLIGVQGKTFGQMEGCTKAYNIGHVKEPFTRPCKLVNFCATFRHANFFVSHPD